MTNILLEMMERLDSVGVIRARSSLYRTAIVLSGSDAMARG